MKPKNIFSLLFGFWILDFFLTIIALNLTSGLVEVNPIARTLFHFGWYGYLIMFAISMGLCYLVSWWLSKRYNRFVLKYGKRKEAFILTMIPIVIFCLVEIVVILHNWFLILEKII